MPLACSTAPGAQPHRGANSVLLGGTSAVDPQAFYLKWYAHLQALEREEWMLNQRDLALVLPPARYVDGKEHRNVLQGRVIVSQAGTPLKQMLASEAASLRAPRCQVRCQPRRTWLCL